MKRLIPGLMLAFSVGCAPDVSAPSGITPSGPNLDVAPFSTTVIVSPTSPHGWVFVDDNGNGGAGSFVPGPLVPPLGVGSASLGVTAANQGYALGAAILGGTKFADMTTISYSTFRSTADAGNNLAIALQFNMDFNLTDDDLSYQGRLVFEPYQTFPGAVTQGAWQTWNALAGKWWTTRPSPCVQETPCTLAQFLTAFPNAGVHATLGAVLLKAGSGWASFLGNADNLTIGANGVDITYDFEPYLVASNRDQCKDNGWEGRKRADGSSFNNQGDCVQYVNTGK